jgi:phosphoglucosamine mutase
MLGGEQSGHLIVLDGHVTGDGIAAALTLCRSLAGRPLAEAAAVMPRFPQAKENVVLPSLAIGPGVAAEVERLNAELAGRGRVLVRASGTEPVVRVLAEAEREEEAAELCGSIADLVRREAGAP